MMSKRIMVSIVTLLAAVALTAALAYSGFNTFNGTGVLGVGQVQPPGRGDPPTALTAFGTRNTYYEWDCVLKTDPDDFNSWWGNVAQGVEAEAVVRMNRHGKVQNYTFVGWVDVGDPINTTDQTNAALFEAVGYPACGLLRDVVVTLEVVTVDDVSFSY